MDNSHLSSASAASPRPLPRRLTHASSEVVGFALWIGSAAVAVAAVALGLLRLFQPDWAAAINDATASSDNERSATHPRTTLPLRALDFLFLPHSLSPSVGACFFLPLACYLSSWLLLLPSWFLMFLFFLSLFYFTWNLFNTLPVGDAQTMHDEWTKQQRRDRAKERKTKQQKLEQAQKKKQQEKGKTKSTAAPHHPPFPSEQPPIEEIFDLCLPAVNRALYRMSPRIGMSPTS